jgi:hypothetical protein
MWVIIERMKNNPNRCWIGGVYKQRQDALEYQERSFHKANHSEHMQELRDIPAQDYPILLLFDRDKSDYFYVTPEELAEKILKYEKVEDEDMEIYLLGNRIVKFPSHEYCTYYILRNDTAPEEELIDDHHVDNYEDHHVDNCEMKEMYWRAITVNCVGGLDGVYTCDNCRKRCAGRLTEKGYEPPLGWHIVPQAEWDSYFIRIGLMEPGEAPSNGYETLCPEHDFFIKKFLHSVR